MWAPCENGILRSIISMFITLIPDKLNVRFCFLNSGVVWSSADVIYLKMVQLTWFLCNLYVLVIGFCFLSWNVGFMGIWIWSKYDCYDIECYELCKFVLMCLKMWNFKLDQITKHFLTFDDLFFLYFDEIWEMGFSGKYKCSFHHMGSGWVIFSWWVWVGI